MGHQLHPTCQNQKQQEEEMWDRPAYELYIWDFVHPETQQ